MANFVFEPFSDGIIQLLKSSEVEAECMRQASAVCQKAGAGYSTDSYSGKTRVNAMVYPDSFDAYKDNASNNTLLKSLGG